MSVTADPRPQPAGEVVITARGRAPRSQRRKLAIGSWRPSRDGRIYTRVELDVGAALAYAATLSAASGVRVTLTHVVGRAVATALRTEPAFTARVLLGRAVPYPSIDVSFAVDVAAGRDLAPVRLRKADTMSTVEMASAVAERTTRIRAGTDRPFATANAWVRFAPRPFVRPVLAFVSFWVGGLGRRAFGQQGFPFGSAFISNVGSLGLDEGMLAPLPLARCPLYLCIGAVRDRAVVVDGEIVVRPVAVLTATADHRLVDGAHAARLAAFLRAALADPDTLDP